MHADCVAFGNIHTRLPLTLPASSHYSTDRSVSYLFLAMASKPAPRPEARWTRRKDARPAELLSAALDIFVERGYAATRLDEVAGRAGVSKGTLYLYYESKADLFKAVIRGGLVPAIERGERLVDEHSGTMAELLEKVIFGWWQEVGTSQLGGIPKLMFAEAKNFPDLAQFYYQEVISRGYRLVQRLLDEGTRRGEFVAVDPEYGTRLILAPLVFLLLWRHSFDICESRHLDPEKYLSTHLRMTLDGLRHRAAPADARGSAR